MWKETKCCCTGMWEKIIDGNADLFQVRFPVMLYQLEPQPEFGRTACSDTSPKTQTLDNHLAGTTSPFWLHSALLQAPFVLISALFYFGLKQQPKVCPFFIQFVQTFESSPINPGPMCMDLT
ncbi:hypothetical protein B0H14DRAFT_2643898 [Mycena olivaceomarginata]|nr:hypothetical protein B0H14DRAFT_2643898 [Mycena olivaceomarginata]